MTQFTNNRKIHQHRCSDCDECDCPAIVIRKEIAQFASIAILETFLDILIQTGAEGAIRKN